MENKYGEHPHPEEVLSASRLERFFLRQELHAARNLKVVLSLDATTVVVLNTKGEMILSQYVTSLD